VVKDEDGNGAFGVSGTDSLTPLIPALNEMCLYFHVSQVWGPDHPFDGRWQNVLLRRVFFLSASATRALSTPQV
jgi:hypothetical protein